MKSEKLYELIKLEKIIVIVRGIEADKIVDLAKAVYDGGIKFLEITCNTVGAAEMISQVSTAMNDKMVIGAGTVITKTLCREVLQAGAKYIIAPDVNPDVIDYCLSKDVAILPGAATATEILTAAKLGAKMVKIFPAAAIGVDYIKYLRGPIDNIDFIAVGGVRVNNMKDFAAAGCVGFGIGGSVVKKEWINNGNWGQVSKAATEYIEESAKLRQ